MTEQRAAPGRGEVLYSPELLGLAVSLAKTPYNPEMSHLGEARSRTCGSTVMVSLEIDASGHVVSAGLRASACAVGQAAAALFVRSVAGHDRCAIASARAEIAVWLDGSPDLPSWPGLETLAAARAHPARHGAILLAWDGALAALSKAKARG